MREYFQVLNEILIKSTSREVLALHMQLCEMISELNDIFAMPIGYFTYANGSCMTFALFELFDMLVAERSVIQIAFGISYSVVIFNFHIMVFLFYLSCSLLSSEKEKSFKMISNSKNTLNSTRNFVNLLQLQSSQQKFSCGLFEFNMKAYFAVSITLFRLYFNFEFKITVFYDSNIFFRYFSLFRISR